MTPEIKWIKTPLQDSLNWPDVPPDLKGRVIVKKWPADTHTTGGIELPNQESRRVVGVAWVVRAIGDAAKILCPGDSVLIPHYAVDAGLQYPSAPGVELADYRMVGAENVYQFLPYADALRWREGESARIMAIIDDELPKLRILAEDGQCGQALAWLNKLKAQAETCCDSLILEQFAAESESILHLAKDQADRKQQAAINAEEKARANIAAERARIAAERNR